MMIHDSIDSILFPCPPLMVDAVVVRVARLLLLLPTRPGVICVPWLPSESLVFLFVVYSGVLFSLGFVQPDFVAPSHPLGGWSSSAVP